MENRKLIVLGIDGMDPKLSKRLLDEGKPVSYTHLDVYKRQGLSGYQRTSNRFNGRYCGNEPSDAG